MNRQNHFVNQRPILNKPIKHAVIKEPKNGFLFFSLIWVIFMLPNTYWTAFPFVIGHSNLSELAMAALPFVYWTYGKRRANWHSRGLQVSIVVFWVACLVGLILQFSLDRANPISLIKTNRIMLPLFVCSALLFLGPRLSSKKILFHFYGAITCSFALGLASYLTGFQIGGFGGNLEEEAFEIAAHGRLYNVNTSFSYFAVAISATLLGASKGTLDRSEYPKVAFAAIGLSIVVGVLSFTRTFLGIGGLFLLVSSTMIFKPKVVATALTLMLVGAGASYFAYNFNENIQRQVDKRIIDPYKEGRLRESMVHEGRREGYRIYREHLGTSLGITGVKPDRVVYQTVRGPYRVNTTDVSFVTVWWRFGIAAVLAWFALLVHLAIRIKRHRKLAKSRFYKRHARFLLIAMTLLALASLNIDVLARHYTILHLAILVIALRDS